jgi:hypothetical protein
MSRVDVIGPTPHWDGQQYYAARLLQHYKTHQQRTCYGESVAYWHLRPIARARWVGTFVPRARDFYGSATGSARAPTDGRRQPVESMAAKVLGPSLSARTGFSDQLGGAVRKGAVEGV